MNMKIFQISKDEKAVIGQVVHLCNVLCEQIKIVFYLSQQSKTLFTQEMKSKSKKVVKFLVVAKDEVAATALVHRINVYDTSSTIYKSLLVISEKEFFDEYGKLETFRERVLSAHIVYSSDGRNAVEHSTRRGV